MDCPDSTTHILLVDDNAESLALLETFLEKEDESVVTHSKTDPQAALDQLSTKQFECIVCDYEMPGLNGLEFFETARAEGHSIPFILYTRKEPDEIASQALAAGADAYHQKQVGTVQYSLLLNRIKTLVEKHRAESRLAYLERKKHIADGGEDIGKARSIDQDELASLEVVKAVADRENTDPIALSPPLHDVIGADALDALLTPERRNGDGGVKSITFTYLGYTITISEDGQITLDD